MFQPLWLVFSVLVILIFAAVTPLAHATPPDPTWIGGFHDNADYDDVILALTGVDGFADTGEPVLVTRVSVTRLRSSILSVNVASRPRLTLSDRAPPLHQIGAGSPTV